MHEQHGPGLAAGLKRSLHTFEQSAAAEGFQLQVRRLQTQ